MENTKAKKLLVIILIILLLCCLGVIVWQYMVIKGMDKNNTTANTETKQESINNENTNMNNNITQETQNNQNEISNQEKTKEQSNSNPEITLLEAKKIIQKNLDIFGAYQGGPEDLIRDFYEDIYITTFEIPESAERIEINEDPYVNSGISYEYFENWMLSYMTQDEFKTSYKLYKNIEGDLYFADLGGSGNSYSIKTIELSSYYDNEYKYNIKALSGRGQHEVKYVATIVGQNGNYVVADLEFVE